MILVKDVPPVWLKMTAQLVIAEMLERSWEVQLYAEGSSFAQVTRTDGRRIYFQSALANDAPHTSVLCANNKLLTNERLKGQPVVDLYVTKDLDGEAMAVAERLWHDDRQVVIKPLDSAHGHGVSVAVKNAHSLKKHFKLAKTFAEEVIIQEYIQDAVEVRALCINGVFQAGLLRIPARITGDGERTVEQLIEAENKSLSRGERYMQVLTLIDPEKADQWLGESLQRVPSKDELVQVAGTANVGTGGETIDCTEDLPKWLIDIIEHAADTMQLPVCGIDLLLKAEPTKNASQSRLTPQILEVNANPSLFIHEYPTTGQARPVVKAFVDSLRAMP